MVVGIIHGYGNAVIGDPFQDLYMQKIATYLNNISIDTIVCSGGFTNPRSEYSEAGSIQHYLQTIGIKKNYILEEESFTTYDNIKNIASIINNLPHTQVYIFASNIHLPKIIFSSLQQYHNNNKPYSNYEAVNKLQHIVTQGGIPLGELDKDIEIIIDTYHFIGFDLGRSYNDTIKQIYASIIESQYHQFEDLNADFVAHRKKIRGITP